MLTKDDLNAIKDLITESEDRLDAKIVGAEDRLDAKIDTESLEVQAQVIQLKAEMKREFKRVHSDQNVIIRHFNEESLRLQDRLEKLEVKVDLQTPN